MNYRGDTGLAGIEAFQVDYETRRVYTLFLGPRHLGDLPHDRGLLRVPLTIGATPGPGPNSGFSRSAKA